MVSRVRRRRPGHRPLRAPGRGRGHWSMAAIFLVAFGVGTLLRHAAATVPHCTDLAQPAAPALRPSPALAQVESPADQPVTDRRGPRRRFVPGRPEVGQRFRQRDRCSRVRLESAGGGRTDVSISAAIPGFGAPTEAPSGAQLAKLPARATAGRAGRLSCRFRKSISRPWAARRTDPRTLPID